MAKYNDLCNLVEKITELKKYIYASCGENTWKAVKFHYLKQAHKRHYGAATCQC